jgi:hypothetical protein
MLDREPAVVIGTDTVPALDLPAVETMPEAPAAAPAPPSPAETKLPEAPAWLIG